jgi:hypothetical protein
MILKNGPIVVTILEDAKEILEFVYGKSLDWFG